MENLKLDIVVFDLRKYNTVDDIQNIINNNDLPIDAQRLSDLSVKYSKVFFDKLSNRVFSVIKKGDTNITISTDAESLLLKIKSLPPVISKKEMSLDMILDKINEEGLTSLTAHEKFFLKKNS